MFERHDHLELLAFVEGELDAAKSERLRQRLEREPRILAAIDRMRADRTALRSLPEPQLPRDFLAELETLVARPMLIEPSTDAVYTKPGEYRRQYRRRTRRIRWARVALAAAVMLSLMAGIWAAVHNSLSGSGQALENMLATAPSESAVPTIPPRPAAPGSGPLHHHRPLPVEVPAWNASTAQGNQSTARAAVGFQVRPVVADFFIVLQHLPNKDAEAHLVQTATLVNDAALVRNFSYAEAQRLMEELRLARGGSRRPGGEPFTASERPTRGEIRELASHLRQGEPELMRGARPSMVETAMSAHLAGLEAQAPSLEHQLELSSRGATHTISVPAGQLRSLLERVATGEHHAVLRLIPQNDTAPSAALPPLHPLASWLQEGPRVRQAFERLAHLPPQTPVYVPVIIRNDGEALR